MSAWLHEPVTGATCDCCGQFKHRGVRSVLCEDGEVAQLCLKCRNALTVTPDPTSDAPDG